MGRATGGGDGGSDGVMVEGVVGRGREGGNFRGSGAKHQNVAPSGGCLSLGLRLIRVSNPCRMSLMV